jgi:hypothetical protein
MNFRGMAGADEAPAVLNMDRRKVLLDTGIGINLIDMVSGRFRYKIFTFL